jgi:putative phosphoesterase
MGAGVFFFWSPNQRSEVKRKILGPPVCVLWQSLYTIDAIFSPMPSLKLALISDVHANLPALEAVLAELEKEGVSRIIHAGDIVDYSPFPNEVIALFQKNGVETIRGNHDLAALTGDTLGFNIYAELCSRWTQINLSEQSKNFLRRLKGRLHIEIAGISIAVYHGSPASQDEYVYFDEADESLLVRADARLLILGHTHWPFVVNLENGTIVNPGSVGQPRDKDPRASFAILTIEESGKYEIELRRLEYNVERTQGACRKAGLPEQLTNWLATGCA